MAPSLRWFGRGGDLSANGFATPAFHTGREKGIAVALLRCPDDLDVDNVSVLRFNCDGIGNWEARETQVRFLRPPLPWADCTAADLLEPDVVTER